MFENYSNASHQYELVSTGLKHDCDKIFFSRENANQHMYKLCGKNGTRITKIYDDKHVKTYICENGVRFFVSRV
jgi:hypothetical protein